MHPFVKYLLIINVIAFVITSSDKYFAKKHMQRVPEKWLFTLAAIGGSIGVLAAMYTFRHKTKHKSFTIGVPTILVLQICAAIAVFIYLR